MPDRRFSTGGSRGPKSLLYLLLGRGLMSAASGGACSLSRLNSMRARAPLLLPPPPLLALPCSSPCCRAAAMLSWESLCRNESSPLCDEGRRWCSLSCSLSWGAGLRSSSAEASAASSSQAGWLTPISTLYKDNICGTVQASNTLAVCAVGQQQMLTIIVPAGTSKCSQAARSSEHRWSACVACLASIGPPNVAANSIYVPGLHNLLCMHTCDAVGREWPVYHAPATHRETRGISQGEQQCCSNTATLPTISLAHVDGSAAHQQSYLRSGLCLSNMGV